MNVRLRDHFNINSFFLGKRNLLETKADMSGGPTNWENEKKKEKKEVKEGGKNEMNL